MTRECHRYEIPKSDDDVTDLNICYGLLEKARLFRESKHVTNYLSEYSGLSAFYDTVQDICGAYLLGWLAHGSTEVRVVRDSSTAAAMYQITIVSEAEDKKWVFTRKWREIEVLNTQLICRIPDARLWGWKNNRLSTIRSVPRPPMLPNNPFIMAVFLQYGLSRAFRCHTRELLMVPKILPLLRPETFSDPEFETTQDEIFSPTSQNLSCQSQEFSRIFHFESFIPAALIHGVAARYFSPYENRSVPVKFRWTTPVALSKSVRMWSVIFPWKIYGSTFLTLLMSICLVQTEDH